jgi:hypothetical protein
VAAGPDRYFIDREAEAVSDIITQVQEDGVMFIELEFTDIFGVLKSIELPVGMLGDALERGVWFDGSSIRGFARIMESDMYLIPDPATYAVLPVDGESKKTARFMCDVYTPDGNLFEGDPRAVLKKVIAETADMGYEFFVGPEVEFYLFKRLEDGSFHTPEFDTGSYFDSSAKDIGSDIRKEIMVALKGFGIDSERAHHEVGVGQHEVGFRYGGALTTADNVIDRRQAGLLRCRRRAPPLPRGQAVHRRAADAHKGDVRDHQPDGQLVQASRIGVRGAGIHLLGQQEPLFTGQDPAVLKGPRVIGPRRDALP